MRTGLAKAENTCAICSVLISPDVSIAQYTARMIAMSFHHIYTMKVRAVSENFNPMGAGKGLIAPMFLLPHFAEF